ncbi:unnamed protein product, partial [Rhizoctonia solani]
YITKNPVDFAGPSFFGGPKDTLVIAASRAGEIYIWERSSAILLHTLTTPSSKELTSLAWNPKSPNQFMLAAAARDGTIRLFKAPTIYVVRPPAHVFHLHRNASRSRFFPPRPRRLEGECKSFMTSYLQCLSKNKNDSTPCRHLNKEYLECRMKRGLMERDSWTNLGLGNLPDSVSDSKPVKGS